MEYRVMMVNDGVLLKKTFYKTKDSKKAFVRYRELISKNKEVIFPKQYINLNGIKKAKHEIYIVKETEEGDIFRVIRDELGRTDVEKPFMNKWTILNSNEYRIEEKFWVYGNDSKSERVTIHEIIKPLIRGIRDKKLTKKIIVVFNKLVIYNDEEFEMVICKCKKDAQRLHHVLQASCNKNKYNNLIFMGTVTTEFMISKMYELIKERTGWPMFKIYRKNTRP